MLDHIFHWFETRLDPYQPYDDTSPPPEKLFAFYRQFLWPGRWILIPALITGFFEAGFEALLIYFAARIVDLVTLSSPENFWQMHQSEIWWMLALILILRPVISITNTLLINQGFFPAQGALVRWRTHRHMLRQSLSFFQRDFAGRIANKQIQIAPAFNDSVYEMLDALWYSSVYLIGASLILIKIDARLMLPLGLWLIGYLCAIWVFIPRIGKTGTDVANARSDLAGRIVDSYTNIQTVKLFAHAAREETYARNAMEDMRWTFARQTRLFSGLDFSLLGLNSLLIIGLNGFAVWLWSAGALTPGAIAATTALSLRLSAMTHWIIWALSTLFQNIGVVREGLETISKPLELKDTPNAKTLYVPKGEVRFENVRFTYGREKGGLNEINLSLSPGERVGLLGRSGAGKSTLANCLLRFFDLEAGQIIIDGQDISGVTQDSLRAAISVVTQDAALLHRSVLENILYGAPQAGKAAAKEAANRAHADFIPDLIDSAGQQGFDALVGERGVKLSGGQRQRIALARAILKNAPILVLDEATSALDSESEAEIQTELIDFMKGKTVLAIAHRLSTIAHLDRLVVMDQGRIVEIGTHSELIAKGGLYTQFWNRQSGGFLGV